MMRKARNARGDATEHGLVKTRRDHRACRSSTSALLPLQCATQLSSLARTHARSYMHIHTRCHTRSQKVSLRLENRLLRAALACRLRVAFCVCMCVCALAYARECWYGIRVTFHAFKPNYHCLFSLSQQHPHKLPRLRDRQRATPLPEHPTIAHHTTCTPQSSPPPSPHLCQRPPRFLTQPPQIERPLIGRKEPRLPWTTWPVAGRS